MISANDPDLEVVVTAFDEAEAASAALDRSGTWRPDQPAVLRQHLALPPAAVEPARDVLAEDGWHVEPGGRGSEHARPELTALIAHRVQKLDALHCSQEASRMAGLAQRRDGQVFGWDALQSPPG
ncbi:hypothetical protein IQ251_01705 [Saccharopolyspora sp. HNM0983]|uniref:Uncharacterized protein n=1 Tax=Saccharopolyspora montiporae TaxID=2781240 RepID=A0A929B6I9_9PSEU|nr:hypothetical protein [Saccharopolyspora sp. HNM0983]MBE9373155.1 hypothetical protein [Saccharopolyspora sp. HNM0983]